MRNQKTTTILQKKEISQTAQKMFLGLLVSKGICLAETELDKTYTYQIVLSARDMRLQYVTDPVQEKAATAAFYDMFGIEKTTIDISIMDHIVQHARIVDTWH